MVGRLRLLTDFVIIVTPKTDHVLGVLNMINFLWTCLLLFTRVAFYLKSDWNII